MNKVKDRVISKDGFVTDSRTHVTALPQGSAWKDCAKCGRSSLSTLCWKCREKES